MTGGALIKDEIDLIDRLRLFKKYRLSCLILFSISLVISLATVLSEKTSYETTTVIQMAKLPSLFFTLDPVLAANDALNLISSEDFLEDIARALPELNTTPDAVEENISLLEEKGEVLILRVKNNNKTRAIAINMAISKAFREKAEQIYAKKIGLVNDLVRRIDTEIVIAEQKISQLSLIAAHFKNSKDFSDISAVIDLNLTICQNLLKQKMYLESQLLIPRKFEITHRPITEVSKRKLSAISFGIIFGLVCCICFIFLMESRGKDRNARF